MPRARTYLLACPVRTPPDDDRCEADITVEAYPGHAATRDEPGEGPEVHVLKADCGHFTLLQEERDEHISDLLDQLSELGEPDHDR